MKIALTKEEMVYLEMLIASAPRASEAKQRFAELVLFVARRVATQMIAEREHAMALAMHDIDQMIGPRTIFQY